MRRILSFLSAVCCLLTATAQTVRVEGGRLQGETLTAEDIIVFRGVPYAAPPTGKNRWRAPQKVKRWKGVRDATHFSHIAMQEPMPQGSFYWKEFYQDGLPQTDEDCLYLNIWTTKEAFTGKQKLPVVMWIHGGAYDHGWSYELEMDGSEWARRGVILVSINYRVGLLGFLCHPLLQQRDGTSGNYGLLDQIAALQWIRRNIARFGGDPHRITVMGQSAGAQSVKNLVSSPLCKKLIAGAIIQSGGGLSRTTPAVSNMEEAVRQGDHLMETMGYNSMQAMMEAPANELMKRLREVQHSEAAIKGLRLRPVSDMKILPQDFNQATLSDQVADIPYLIGSNLQDNRQMEEQITDFARHRSTSGHQPVYVYRFDRQLPGDEAGAFHSAELWYMFGTLSRSWRPFTEGDYALSNLMLDCWTDFAKYGEPRHSWAPFPFTRLFNTP